MEKLSEAISAMAKLEVQLTKDVDATRHKMIASSSGAAASSPTMHMGADEVMPGHDDRSSGLVLSPTASSSAHLNGPTIPPRIAALREARKQNVRQSGSRTSPTAANTEVVGSGSCAQRSDTEDF